MFRPLEQFKTDVEASIKELKNAPKAEGFDEIYFPGEQSYNKKKASLEAGELEISDNLYSELEKLMK